MGDTLALLRSASLLRHLPDTALEELGAKLKPLPLADGAVLFEEGSQGRGMYFVSEGKIRISKKAAGGATKDLAILGAGECFGEMDLVGGARRSASASAAGPCVVLELDSNDMSAWLKAHPDLAMSVFSELAQVQSTRLRRTSDELTLLFDLSQLILERHKTPKDLLRKALDYVVPHVEGQWSARAYIHNPYSEETEQVAATGDVEGSPKLPGPTQQGDGWLDARAYWAALPGPKQAYGLLLFQSREPLPEQMRRNASRVLVTVARLLAAAVENINFQTEEALRARLKSQSYGTGI